MPGRRRNEARLRVKRDLVERELIQAGERLARAREELAALDEQVAWFEEATDDARMRALVTESKADQREFSEAERHSQAIARSRADLVAHIARLRRLQEELLEELPAQDPAPTDERVS
ncbi:MAG TPA: hypothetical protein VMY88_12640 [Acidimicrobiales bacterium]|nr:hypothetical protein [Acidimicrobiales bacterium]